MMLKVASTGDERMLPAISIVGRSNSGKTTLLEKVIAELKLRGFRVGVIKHAHHGFDMDHQGKDSWRFAAAGSDMVAITSPGRTAFFQHTESEPGLTETIALFEGKTDVVLVEGYKGSDTAKILVLAAGGEPEPLRLNGEILATVSAAPCSSGVPQFDNDTVVAIVNLVIAQIAMGGSLRGQQLVSSARAR